MTPEGRSERGGFPVFKRDLRQWMMRITAYAPRLLGDLEALEWPESIKAQQRHGSADRKGPASVSGHPPASSMFSTRPETLFGATFLALSPIIPPSTSSPPGRGRRGPGGMDAGASTPADAVAQYRAVTGGGLRGTVSSSRRGPGWTGAYAPNPATGRQIPVFVADYVLMTYGTGAVMGVPARTSGPAVRRADVLPIAGTVQPPAGWQGETPIRETALYHQLRQCGDLSLDSLTVTEART